MKLLANENFPAASVFYLRSKGYDTTYIAENLKSISDRAVMDLAIAEQRTILTFDRDYGKLIFKHRYKPPHGVIYLRLAFYAPEEPGRLIDELLLKGLETANRFTIYDGEMLRQRSY